MAASFAPTPKRHLRVREFAVVAALLGTFLTAPSRGESVSLSGKSAVLGDRVVSAGVDHLAAMNIQAPLGTPAAAAALQMTAETLIPLSDLPPSDRRRRPKRPLKATADDAEAKAAMLAVPEPTTMVLGLTSTLVLASLSWKRRLTHAHPSRG